VTNKTPKVHVACYLGLYKKGVELSSCTRACRSNLLKCWGNFLDIMIRHFNQGIYRRLRAMRRMASKQKVIAQVLGIAQGTVSKVLKRNRETGVPTPRARSGRPRKTTEREDRYLLRLCRNGRTKSANNLRDQWLRFTNTPCIKNASEFAINTCRLLRQETSEETFIVANTSTGAYGLG